MRRLFLLIYVFFAAQTISASNLDFPYTPTRGEWIEIIAFKTATQYVSMWPLNVSVFTMYRSTENTVVVIITNKHGERQLTKADKDLYESTLKSHILLTVS